MGGSGYFYYKQTQATLDEQRERLAVYKVKGDEQDKTIAALQENLEKTAQALDEMSVRNAEIEAEKQRYLSIFAKHDLTKLATAKPGLIQKRFNKGTADVFKSIEDDTRIVDSIDN